MNHLFVNQLTLFLLKNKTFLRMVMMMVIIKLLFLVVVIIKY